MSHVEEVKGAWKKQDGFALIDDGLNPAAPFLKVRCNF
jgi:hypothetical protein